MPPLRIRTAFLILSLLACLLALAVVRSTGGPGGELTMFNSLMTGLGALGHGYKFARSPGELEVALQQTVRPWLWLCLCPCPLPLPCLCLCLCPCPCP